MAAATAAAVSLRWPLPLRSNFSSYLSSSKPHKPSFSLETSKQLTASIFRRFLSPVPSKRRFPFPSSAEFSDGEYYTGASDEGEVAEEEFREEESYETRGAVPREAGRLYVGNLPFSTTSSELAEVFSAAGTVETVEVIYDRVTDRSRGFAFVTMATIEEANRAVEMFDGSQVGGRSVKVNFPEVPRGGEREVMGTKAKRRSQQFIDSPHKVYAGNLGWSLTSDALHNVFIAQTGLLGAKVIFDRDTGRSRGFGFVTFASSADAEAAIEAMNGVEVEGRPLRLSLAAGRSGGSSSSATEKNNADPQATAPVMSYAAEP